MVIRGDELLNAAEIVAKNRNFQVNLKYSAGGGVLAGLTTAASGLALGPPGLILGGAVGGFLGYFLSKDKFKPLHEIIAKELTADQRQQLVAHLRRALQDFDISDVAQIATLVLSNGALQNVLATTVLSFAQQELQLKIQ